jgi:glycosyltransferase involved in cell wall biosynthesis
VTNTYLAVDVPSPTPAEVEAVCAAAGLRPGDYILHAGTIERRKNIGRLIEAYRASFSTRALVLAGPEGWGAAEELAAADGLLVAPGAEARAALGRPRVMRIDWMGRSELVALMRGAAAVVAPALAEGFGLPVMEAMALGVPTLTSDSGAPREVAGKAAMLIDPLDVRAMAAGLTALDQDAGLRAALRAAGRVRAQIFSQEAYAARLAALYQDVLDRAA